VLHWKCPESFRHVDGIAEGIVKHQPGKRLLQRICGGAVSRSERFFRHMLVLQRIGPVPKGCTS